MPASDPTDPAPLSRSSFADVTASDYPAAPPEDPEPGRGGRSIFGRDGDLVARLRFLVETDRDRAVLLLADAVGPDVLDSALAVALPGRPGDHQ